MVDAEPRLRADARRNRTRLLAAAATAFRAGREPPLEQVARDAGVGIGTLYRHFSTREALIEAVYRHELDTLGDGVDALLTDRDDAAAALRAWTDRYADFVSTKRGMAGVLKAMIADGTLAAVGTRKVIHDALATMLEAGAVDGSMRPGIDADDIVTVLVGIFLATDGADDRVQVGRLLDLVVSGLRP